MADATNLALGKVQNVNSPLDDSLVSRKTFHTITQLLQNHQHLLAVSKYQSLEKIRALHSLGQINFGENYIQEALEKIEILQSENLQWHLIGSLQKNKVKFLKKNFAYIHSVDSLQLADLIARKASEISYQQKVFIQVNFSAEESKSGFSPDQFELVWPQLKELAGLEIVGLMTMPPLQNNPEENRLHFKSCFELGKKYALKEFSMGTSHDYQVALEEGATWIRVGTALFGERQS